jgi:hypothetical protein
VHLPVDILATGQFLALEIAARSMFSLEMRQQGATLRRHIAEFLQHLAQPFFLDMMLPPGIPACATSPACDSVAVGRFHGPDHRGAAAHAD